MKKTYLVGNIFEDDFLQRKIKTNPDLIFRKLERLRIENNLLHEKSDVIKMVAELTTTMNEVKEDFKPLKKALNTKLNKVKTNQTKEDILLEFRTNQLLK
ncbi:hypothetical protein [Pedobacter sp. N23S346]|uniref:hypothetical protein n=1 Tax=Pedobacter sp. N23S346 TaxID=3402750 RepID=UPI003AD75EA2